jgi:CheY-like chemotaxis protein
MKMENRFHFLFIDDEPFSQIIGRHIIECSGHSLDVASSAEQALVLLEKNQYHLVFLDLGLPNVSGLELNKKLRETMNLKVPIVAVTAFDAASKKRECMEHGFSDFMEKPFSDDKFKEMITKFLIPASICVVG